jgi:hypothetical protein
MRGEKLILRTLFADEGIPLGATQAESTSFFSEIPLLFFPSLFEIEAVAY